MMQRKKRTRQVLEYVEITDAGSTGKAVARRDDMVIFVPYAVPGDIADIIITRKRKNYAEGKAIHFHHLSKWRTSPVCDHFGVCGGCKWQHMEYAAQLYYKQKQVEENFIRLGKLDIPEIMPIVPSERTEYYRNKLEYTFSNRKWLTEREMNDPNKRDMNALGFHVAGMFDRVVDISRCYLQKDPSNEIRNAIKKYALDNDIEFYDVKKRTGLLRNLIIRNTESGDLMVIVVFSRDEKEIIKSLLSFCADTHSEITSLMYVVNPKHNDVISDLDIQLFKGEPTITEKIRAFDYQKELHFKIGPVSFFQTNSGQASLLYRIAAGFAGLKPSDTVYDLYTGTGTIANYIASSVKKVVGIDSVPSAIEDARENAKINDNPNTHFHAGDIAHLLDDDFIARNGKPDVVITDPPRTGMHGRVVNQLLKISPERIVYISCNPATQGRDLAMVQSDYLIEKIQPVDMFPHTHHVENVVLLKNKYSCQEK